MRNKDNMVNFIYIPINLKLTLTVQEAAAYSGIGQNRIAHHLREPGCPFAMRVGSKIMVKRQEFEEYISKVSRM